MEGLNGDVWVILKLLFMLLWIFGLNKVLRIFGFIFMILVYVKGVCGLFIENKIIVLLIMLLLLFSGKLVLVKVVLVLDLFFVVIEMVIFLCLEVKLLIE